jgi:hypothetical protein
MSRPGLGISRAKGIFPDTRLPDAWLGISVAFLWTKVPACGVLMDEGAGRQVAQQRRGAIAGLIRERSLTRDVLPALRRRCRRPRCRQPQGCRTS